MMYNIDGGRIWWKIKGSEIIVPDLVEYEERFGPGTFYC